MKKLNLKLFFIFIFSSVLPVFSDYPDTELLIYNYTGVDKIYIQLYPFGSLFEGYNDANPVP